MSRPIYKKFGTGEGLVGCCQSRTRKYYIRNKYGGEIDIHASEIDDLIEKLVIIRNKTRRVKR